MRLTDNQRALAIVMGRLTLATLIAFAVGTLLTACAHRPVTDELALPMAAPVRLPQAEPPATVPNRGQRVRVFPR